MHPFEPIAWSALFDDEVVVANRMLASDETQVAMWCWRAAMWYLVALRMCGMDALADFLVGIADVAVVANCTVLRLSDRTGLVNDVPRALRFGIPLRVDGDQVPSFCFDCDFVALCTVLIAESRCFVAFLAELVLRGLNCYGQKVARCLLY